MNKIYFDTEFEGLKFDAALISIGLTNASGSHVFYAELSDSYRVENCNDFCKSEVLPLLEHGEKRMTHEQLCKALWSWLVAQGESTVLICDSHRDIIQIKYLFPKGLPTNCSYEVLCFVKKWERRIANRERKIHKEYGLRVHHALDDAIVNRIIFEGK